VAVFSQVRFVALDRGQCYDHFFSAIFANFRREKMSTFVALSGNFLHTGVAIGSEEWLYTIEEK
jgi:hypothetical protein